MALIGSIAHCFEPMLASAATFTLQEVQYNVLIALMGVLPFRLMFTLTKPNDPSGYAFERMCLTIFRHHFRSLDANFYGQNATGQRGIDLRLTTNLEGRRELVIVQCKDTKDLHFSTFENDLKAALLKFGPLLETDHELYIFFIVATTVDRVNTDDIDVKCTALIEKHLSGEMRTRWRRPEVLSWAWIREKVESCPELRQIFSPVTLPGDAKPSFERDKLALELRKAFGAMHLRTARDALMRYYRAENIENPEDYGWLSSDLLDDLLTLYMVAGDFERARRLLIFALGAHRFAAKYLVEFLRAHRVLAFFPRTARQYTLQDLFSKVELRTLKQEIELIGCRLGQIQGTVDELLTLALWLVSYSENHHLADEALILARGIFTQAWPERIRPFDPDGTYVVCFSGAVVENIGGIWYPNVKWQLKDQYKGALILAYNYLRQLHSLRFGMESTKLVEGKVGAWPDSLSYGEYRRALPLEIAELDSRLMFTLAERLPMFSREWCGRNFLSKDERAETPGSRPKLDRFSYGCTAKFLLRDCAENLVAPRMNELGSTYSLGKKLIVSHKGLEHLAMAHLHHSIWAKAEIRVGNLNERMCEEIKQLAENTVRVEMHGPRDYRIVSYSCYLNFPMYEWDDDLSSVLALCVDMGSDFIAATKSELDFAAQRLSPNRRTYLYWKAQDRFDAEAHRGPSY